MARDPWPRRDEREAVSNDAYAALRRPSYRRFLAGAFSVNLGAQFLKIAAGFHLYTVTHQAWALAGLGLANYLPIFVLSLPAGWAADHYDRRQVLRLAQAIQLLAALGLLGLVALGGPTWGWYPLVFLHACGRALQTPSSVSLYPLLIEPAEVPRAVSWNSATYQLGAVLGPVLAGLSVHFLGVLPSLAVVVAGPALSLALISRLQLLRQPPSARVEPLKEKILGGFRFVRAQRAILGALSVDFVEVLFGGVDGILPMFTEDILHCGAWGLGLLQAAIFVGAFIMSGVLAHKPRLPQPGKAMLAAVAGFGLCMLVFAWSKAFWLSFGALVAAGMLDQVSVYVRQTLVQLRTPEQLRGRVQAVNFFFIGSSNELGEFESGVSAAWLGPVGSVLMGGVAVLLTVATWSVLFKELRTLGSLAPDGPAAAP
jgi:MFS family permease